MSTTVLLEVTVGVDANPGIDLAPGDVVAAVRAAGQPVGHGWSRRGDGPWRLRFQLTGVDRVAVGHELTEQMRILGYDAHLSIWR